VVYERISLNIFERAHARDWLHHCAALYQAMSIQNQ